MKCGKRQAVTYIRARLSGIICKRSFIMISEIGRKSNYSAQYIWGNWKDEKYCRLLLDLFRNTGYHLPTNFVPGSCSILDFIILRCAFFANRAGNRKLCLMAKFVCNVGNSTTTTIVKFHDTPINRLDLLAWVFQSYWRPSNKNSSSNKNATLD